jgi:cell division protein FtsI/penicillin-binding protein 2
LRHKKKKENKKKSHLPTRLNLLFFVVFLLFSGLVLRLGVVQIVQGKEYKKQVEMTDVESVNYSVPRGEMYDNDYTKIVYNIPQKAITYTPPKNPQPKELLEVAKKLAQYIQMPKEDIKKVRERDLKDIWLLEHDNGEDLVTKSETEKLDDKDIYKLKLDRVTEEHMKTVDKNVAAIYGKIYNATALTPTIVKNKDVTDVEYAMISENLGDLPGVDVTTDWQRAYTYDDTFRGILGTVKTGLPEEKVDYYKAKGYSLNDRVGYTYLEEYLEDILQGTKSKVRTVTNKQGDVVEQEIVSEGKSGKDVVLTVDMEFQAKVEQILMEEILNAIPYPNNNYFNKAFIVVLNPKTGEILSMAGKQYDEKAKSWSDYASGTFTSAFEPGSVVKGATVLMGYQVGAIQPGTIFRDEPMPVRGRSPIRSAGRAMGPINEIKALERSSNVYMAKIVYGLAGDTYRPNASLNWDYKKLAEKMRYYYAQFGLGTTTGIGFANEAIGVQNEPDNPGLLLNFSFGQFDTYTTLQLAQYVATIANNGYRMKPMLVKEIREQSVEGEGLGPIIEKFNPVVLNRIDLKPEWLERVQRGFYQVVNGSEGTAKAYFNNVPVKVAGKTGTAESYVWDEKLEKGVKTYNINFVGYAPYEDPEIAFAIVAPNVYNDGGARLPYNISARIGERVVEAYYETKEEKQDQLNNETEQEDTQAEAG